MFRTGSARRAEFFPEGEAGAVKTNCGVSGRDRVNPCEVDQGTAGKVHRTNRAFVFGFERLDERRHACANLTALFVGPLEERVQFP